MKGIVLNKYGSTNDLSVMEIQKPKAEKDHALIKILYTSINSADLDTNNQKDLFELGKLWQDGKIKPIIDRVIPLDQTIEGLKSLEEGHVLGKIVVKNFDAIE